MCPVVVEAEKDYLVATLHGELVLNCSHEAKEVVKSAVTESKNYRLIVDLSDVEFIDSSGLGVLIAWFKLINQSQGQVVYSGMTDYIKKIVGLAKLDKIFTLSATLDEAKALLA